MLIHHHTIRVRYGETDQMGYMYYGNYPAFLEVARAELLRSIDFPTTPNGLKIWHYADQLFMWPLKAPFTTG